MRKTIHRVFQWVKAHKRELILAGVCIAATLLAIYLARNWDAVQAIWNELLSKLAGTASVTVSNSAAVEPVTGTVQAVVDTAVETPVISSITRSAPGLPFEVRMHIRNLPSGWHASAEKLAEAAEFGYELQPGQTWVSGYTKYAAAA